MFRSKHPKVTICIPKSTLETIFDECDKYDLDETGGRIVGTYRKKRSEYYIDVLAVIEAGPNARRSPTSLFQDGEYQEKVFRQLEKHHPNLEHLGSWHTHHVNGLQTLSGGDRATYQRTVNHEKHNIDFFYALLVTRRSPGSDVRYEVKHFVVFRNDDTIHEIGTSQVHLIGTAKPQPTGDDAPSYSGQIRGSEANLERVKDQDFFSEFYRGLQPAFSNKLGTLYWKGEFSLIDGTNTTFLAMENAENGRDLSYSITIIEPKGAARDISEMYKQRTFRSARHGLMQLERDINRELYLRATE